MEQLGIVISLFLLMYIAYRGFSVILFAPILALLAAAMQGMHIMPGYTELFMERAAAYFKTFFPVFLLGAVLGKVMEDTGMARSIAVTIVDKLGAHRAIMAIVLAATVLTYGGVSLFVVVFAVYPLAAAIFKEADIPKRLIPGCIALGAFGYTMTMLPGTPQIQNIIPTSFYGTTTFAAPIIGLLAALMQFSLGMLWLERRRKAAQAAGEGYGNHTLHEPTAAQIAEAKDGNYPSFWVSILPLVLVIVVNFYFTTVDWNNSILAPFQKMGLKLIAPNTKAVVGIWALIIGLVVGLGTAVLLGFKYIPKSGSIQKSLNAGAIGSLLAIMNTASEVGYGNVISALPGFKTIANFLLEIKIGGTPLISEFLTVNILAGVTGSASGGMSIALAIMAQEWLNWANQVGVSPEMLHRVASMASGGMDTLPHNGAVITLLAVCGLTHIESYKDICVTSLIIPFAVGVVMILLYQVTGIL